MTADPAALRVRPLTAADWPRVRTIYAEGISTRNATFEQEPPDWETWNSSHLPDLRLAGEADGLVVGWAALSLVSRREAYRGVAEVSVYVSEEARGRGVGRSLLSELVERSERAGIWTLQAGIFPENTASLRLHEACGFRLVGVRERVGRQNSGWRDVLLLERRSAVVR